MKKSSIIFLVLLSFFLFSGLFFCFKSYSISKEIWVQSNESIIETILENHPELEKEVIESLKNQKENQDLSILQKYGLTNLANLEYLEQVKQYQKIYYGSFFLFLFSSFLLFLGFFCYQRYHEKKEIMKIDRYLFSLLSQEINVDLRDFQSGELASLQNDLLKVTTRLKNSLEMSKKAKKELAKNLADISHQLKTPLTSLFLIHEALKAKEMSEEVRTDFLKKEEQVLDHMDHLITSLLKVSQVESGTITLKKETLFLKKMIENILKELEVLAQEKHIKIIIQMEDDLKLMGDAIWLKEAIFNLMKNSIEHSKENGTIWIMGKDTSLYLELKIIDNGSGIMKEDLPHIFERFYKGHQKSKGIGIGLNLTKSILDRMNATIRVKSKPNEKTSFIIHFYRNII